MQPGKDTQAMTITITKIDTGLFKMTEQDATQRNVYWVNTRDSVCSCGAICCRHRTLLRYGAEAAAASLRGETALGM